MNHSCDAHFARWQCPQLPPAAVALILVAGCTRYEYNITMTPRGPEMQRTIRVAQVSESSDQKQSSLPPDEEVSRLEEAYGQPAERERSQVLLKRTFTDALPQDVGGAGSYTHWDTSLGSASFYVERFRGSTDLYGQTQQRLEAADMAVDMVWAFVDADADDSPAGRRLRAFVDDELRRDAKNAVLLIWAMQVLDQHTGEEASQDIIAVRGLQFLLERDYVTLDAALDLLREESSTGRQFETFVKQLSRKLVLTKSEILSALPSLSSEEELAVAFNNAVMESNVYIAWRAQRPDEDDSAIDETQRGTEAFVETIGAAVGHPLSEHDRLNVRLQLPQPPISTNGVVTEDGTIQWTAEIGIPGQGVVQPLPTLCYAGWSEANADFQTDRFGKVLLEGRPLGEYVIWRRGLDDEEGNEWDRFLADVMPEESLRKKLDGFRFSTSPPGDAADSRIAAVRSILFSPDESD